MSNDLTLTENQLIYRLPDQAQLEKAADLAFSAAMCFLIQNDDDLNRATQDMNQCSKRAKELEKCARKSLSLSMRQKSKSWRFLSQPQSS